MSEEEKLNHAQLIEGTINTKMDAKMNPIYWMVGTMLTIFVTISVPLTLVLIDTVEKTSNKVDKVVFDAAIKERERDYLMKLDYYKMEEDEHKDILEAFQFPDRASFVFEQINQKMRREMGFNYSTSRGGTK